MLAEYATETGVGIAQSHQTGVYYLVQLFGRPRSAAFQFQIVNRDDKTIKYSLGEKDFELPPGFTRQHEMCKPRKLKLADAPQTSPIVPEAGDKLLVRSRNGVLTLDRYE